MSSYESIFNKILSFAEQCDRVRAVILFGSRARLLKPADKYSDYDLIFFVKQTEYFLYEDAWLDQIAEYQISFTEPTAVNGFERRVFFENAMDFDFLFYPEEKARQVTESKTVQSWYARGYRILVDKIGYENLVVQQALPDADKTLMSSREFLNIVNTFWFHAVWSSKKLLRGEIWPAKNCIDNYMKELLRQMAECHVKAHHGPSYDTWHEGRFFDQWADSLLLSELQLAYGGYDRNSLSSALWKTMDLFRTVAREAASRMDYTYSEKAEVNAMQQVEQLLF